jgi:16S rRNA processing protein RimM
LNSSTEPELFSVGRLGRPHGLDGYLGLYVDEGDLIHFETGSTVFVGAEPFVVEKLRRVDRGHQVMFRGVGDRDSAELLRGREVFSLHRRQLVSGEFWIEDLVGMRVYDETGTDLGEVAAVEPGSAQDRLVVTTPTGRFEIPFVDDLVPVVDPERRRIEIVVIPGLLD